MHVLRKTGHRVEGRDLFISMKVAWWHKRPIKFDLCVIDEENAHKRLTAHQANFWVSPPLT